MKTLKIIIGLFFLIFLMNCRDNQNSRNANDASNPAATTNDQYINDEASRTRDNINAADSMNNVAQNNRNNQNQNNSEVNAADNNRMNKMFADLNFTPEQIEEFNTNYRRDMEDWKRNNASTTISPEEHARLEDRQMKSFLSSAQYQQYQNWVKDNPVKNQR